MQIKGRTLSLYEGKLSTSEVLYKKPTTADGGDEQHGDTKTDQVSIEEESVCIAAADTAMAATETTSE